MGQHHSRRESPCADLRPHLTYANIMVTPAALSAHLPAASPTRPTPSSALTSSTARSSPPDIGNNQVYSADVRDDTLANGGLSGADIKNKSGVDTCETSLRIDDLCFMAENQTRIWDEALQHCGNLDLRLPTVGEAKRAGADPRPSECRRERVFLDRRSPHPWTTPSGPSSWRMLVLTPIHSWQAEGDRLRDDFDELTGRPDYRARARCSRQSGANRFSAATPLRSLGLPRATRP